MVRAKAKAPKGDDAFRTRKQKVGRKKLQPATATRAEVHARSLRVATSTAMAQAARGDPLDAAAGQSTRTSSTAVARPFAELLAHMHHYKAAQRASAFGAVAKLLQAEESRRAAGTRVDAFAGFLSLPPAGEPGDQGPGPRGGLTPLERLRTFTAALEAITDTDDEVRRAALSALGLLLRQAWLSPGTAAPDRRGAEAGCGETEVTLTAAQMEASWLRRAALLRGESASATSTAPAPAPPIAASGAVEVAHAKAILQAIHVALTHAMRSVRLSGVELLALLLRHTGPGLLRVAAREVCRQQRQYLQGAPLRGGVHDAFVRAGGGEEAEEEQWMMDLVRRVSSLVLRTTHVVLLPRLLSALLVSAPADGSEADAARPPTPGSSTAVMEEVLLGEACQSTSAHWRHPELVRRFFEDVLSPWSSAWKEAVELRLQLFRQEEHLQRAVALARGLAVVLTFLRQRQPPREGDGTHPAKRFFLSRAQQQHVREVFIHHVPVSMAELLRQGPEGAAGGKQGDGGRRRFAGALASIAVPLAESEDGWGVLQQYLRGVFPGGASAPFAFRSARELLAAMEIVLRVLCLFPPPPTRGGGGGGPARHVTDKMIEFGPAVMRAVVLVARPPGASRGVETDDALLARLLLCANGIVSRLLGASVAPPGSREVMGETLLLLPRLLFALRGHVPGHGGEETAAVDLFTEHPALVDLVVDHVLHVLWGVASGRHPVLLRPDHLATGSGRPRKKSGAPPAKPIVRLLRTSMELLFGVLQGGGAAPVADALTARCHPATVQLAHHVLFYLGASAAVEEVRLVLPPSDGALAPLLV